MKYNSVLDTIGNTPIIRINRLAPKNVQLYVKTESRNPGGSVKDRLAYAVINDAERRGVLKPGQTVVEATSGNTGIALALVGAARGYKVVLTMPETMSLERRVTLRHDRNLLRRAAQTHPQLWRQSHPDPCCRTRGGHGARCQRTRREKRLVPR